MTRRTPLTSESDTSEDNRRISLISSRGDRSNSLSDSSAAGGTRAPKSGGVGAGATPASGGVSHDAPQDRFIAARRCPSVTDRCEEDRDSPLMNRKIRDSGRKRVTNCIQEMKFD
ncbi:hypothetical protein OJAV_G00082020 [Oryzias javanicus]|uniref:Uncharacterized protein n=1 Tax=Oryzias javanicus TaxID=123683 RepID=A0A437D5B8_ORYJA|nr:hypothetical protein OJAV_G00082020 [Oryzias javanicus]